MRFLKSLNIAPPRHGAAPDWLTAQPFAHRGLHDSTKGIIENSPSAFAQAIKAGCGIELDVQLSADGQALVFHDDNLERLVGLSRPLSTVTADEAATLRFTGSEDTIPTLAKVLAMVDGRVPVLVEIKSAPRATGPLELAVAKLLDDYPGPVAIMSFNPDSVAWFADHRPQVTRGFIASPRYRHELGWRLSHVAGQAAAAARCHPDFVAYDIRSIPNRFTRGVRTAGLPLLTWTVRSESDHARAAAHTDNVIFEHP
ncbi:glycerophosphodiester phosphodiesterase family protein [Govanella unica]|uniref:Glycerophosphodiester phosphodiesterase n=1 Tax=Govanella unica TaxID=2975056 RepID=A0A9X3TWM7_9PROT|nr:glycerophosphodiester phosphodiesterase family protein [Govania unica]MDA5193106.1 glycerophosphodiester phosphodiesterase [Govania unica]